MPRTRLALVAVVMAMALVSGCGGSRSVGASVPAQAFRGSEVKGSPRAPDFALRDQDAKIVRLSKLRGKVLLITFIYTHCPDVCPLIATNLNQALRGLGDARAKARVLAVSVDPEGDTRSSVDKYIRQRHLLPEFRYLTGTKAELAPVWAAYHVEAVARDPGLVDHVAYTVLVDQTGRQRVIYDSQVQARDVLKDARGLLGQA